MTPKRTRWECPAGLHPGVLASSRPKKNATVRFCWPCSEETGVLVERVAPALESQRNRKAAVRDAKRERDATRAREAKATATHVSVVAADGTEKVLNAGALLRKAWQTDVLGGGRQMPELVIRRGAPEKGRGHARRRPVNADIRADDRVSGHAFGGGRIVLTVRPGLGEAWLRAVVVHEAAHAARPEARHGALWRSAYVRAIRELYPDAPLAPMPDLDGLPNWRLDEEVVRALKVAR